MADADDQLLYDAEIQRREKERANDIPNDLNFYGKVKKPFSLRNFLAQLPFVDWPLTYSRKLIDGQAQGPIDQGNVIDLNGDSSQFTYSADDALDRFADQVSKGVGTFNLSPTGHLQYSFTGPRTQAYGLQHSLHDFADPPIDRVTVSTASLKALMPQGMDRFPAPVGDVGALGRVDRSAFFAQLQDPHVMAAFISRLNSEVGSQGALAQQAFCETIFNRATCRGQSLLATLTGSYYPTSDPGQMSNPALQAIIMKVYSEGTNITNLATGNASGTVGFGGGPETYASHGERFGRELADLQKLGKIKFGPPVLTADANEAQLRQYDLYLQSVHDKLSPENKTLADKMHEELQKKITEVQDKKKAEAPAVKTDPAAPHADAPKPVEAPKPSLTNKPDEKPADKPVAPKPPAPPKP